MSDDNEQAFDHLHNVGECTDGSHHMVATKDGQAVGMTHMRQLKDGEPINGKGTLYYIGDDGKVVDTYESGGGPAQVATPKYREGWDAIFGKKPDVTVN